MILEDTLRSALYLALVVSSVLAAASVASTRAGVARLAWATARPRRSPLTHESDPRRYG
jgi:hypothetical protein